MKKTLASILLALFAGTSFGAYTRLATETYPGGGSTGGVTPGVATNIAANIVQRDVAPWAMAGQPMPSGGGVTTNAVKDIVANEGYIKSDALNGYATETWVEGKGYVTESVTNGILTAAKAHADQYANQAPDYANVSNLASTAVQTEVDPTVSAWAKAATKPTYTAAEVGADATGTAAAATNALATVSHTGSYNDLTDKPTIGGITTNDVMNIAASASVTNAGAVAVAQDTYIKKSGDTMTGALTIVRESNNIKIDGSTVRFNDEDGDPTGGTIGPASSGHGGDLTIPNDSGIIALTSDIPDAYTKSEIDAKGYVTKSITNGLASTAWVEGQEYVTKSVTNGILTAAKTYADQYANQAPDYETVSNKAMTAVQPTAISDMATKTWVTNQNYVTKTVTNGLASTVWVETWVTNKNYVTESVTNGILSAAKDYADEQIAKYHNFSPVWSAPGLWALEFELGYTSSVIGHVSTITNLAGQIISRDSIEYIYGNYADLYAELYDEYCIDPPIISSFSCSTPGGTVSPAGRLTVTSNGVYVCSATDTKGKQSTVEVPIQSSRQEVKERPIYDSDLVGSVRKTINDDAKTVIQSATLAGTGIYEGQTYNFWNFFEQPAWAKTSAGAAGNVRLFAIGTTVMASAWHYPKHIRWQGTQVVGGVTVTKGKWESLYEWGLSNGWDKVTLDGMGVSDIAMIPLTSGTIALTDLPYLMSEEQLSERYDSLDGIQCWTSVQAFLQPLNAVYHSAFGTGWTCHDDSVTFRDMDPWRSDMPAATATLGASYPAHSGDSGHPVYFKDEAGRFILTSHYTFVRSGANYIKSFPLVKAYVEAHGGQIRELP